MISELVIITPGISPGSGGVADHTLALLREWPRIANVTVLVPGGDSGPGEWSGNIKQLGRNSDAILPQLPSNRGKVFVQYSAYGFDRLGYPRELIRALIEWKKRAGGQLVVMFHEIWAFWAFTNKNFLIQQLHRRRLKQLIQVCDAVFTTTSSQAEHLRRLTKAPLQAVPVGSNISTRRSTAKKRENGWAALFGLQTSRIRALENMRKSLAALGTAGRIKRIVCVGAGSNATDRERELLLALNLSDGFAQDGAVPSDRVSEILSSVSFGIFGQNELSCSKSGSFMAYAAHQLNVLADFADPSKPPPVCWLVAPAELLKGIPEHELARRAECLRMWQEQNCSWKVIANRIGGALGIEFQHPNAA